MLPSVAWLFWLVLYVVANCWLLIYGGVHGPLFTCLLNKSWHNSISVNFTLLWKLVKMAKIKFEPPLPEAKQTRSFEKSPHMAAKWKQSDHQITLDPTGFIHVNPGLFWMITIGFWWGVKLGEIKWHCFLPHFQRLRIGLICWPKLIEEDVGCKTIYISFHFLNIKRVAQVKGFHSSCSFGRRPCRWNGFVCRISRFTRNKRGQFF